MKVSWPIRRPKEPLLAMSCWRAQDAGGARSKSPPKSLGLFWVSKGEATEMAEVPTTSGRQLFALLIDPDA